MANEVHTAEFTVSAIKAAEGQHQHSHAFIHLTEHPFFGPDAGGAYSIAVKLETAKKVRLGQRLRITISEAE